MKTARGSQKRQTVETALTRKQESAVSALIAHPTMKDAAQAAGVGETTLWRWLQLPEFERAYRQVRRETVKHAIVKLQSAAGQAVDVLTEIMNDQSAVVFARLAAAKAVLEISFKSVEIEDLAARLADLETVFNEQREKKA